MRNSDSVTVPQALSPSKRIALRTTAVAAWIGVAFGFVHISALPLTSQAVEPGQPAGLYDENPDHLWNRLHRALFVREKKDGVEYGYDDTVPFNPKANETFLTGEAQQKALAVLDEFLSNHGEGLIQDPVKRAVLQHDLWAAFDNELRAYPSRDRVTMSEVEHDRRELLIRLARCIQRLALPGEQIKALPDNFALAMKSGFYAGDYDPEHPEKPFLPTDLFDPKGSWVEIMFNTTNTASTPQVEEVTAPVHVATCSGRSAFELFMRLPGGREETLSYLNKLNLFTTPWKCQPAKVSAQLPFSENARGGSLQLNPDTPQFPAGTMVALVRRMMLVSDKIEPVATPLLESVQLRVYRKVPAIYSEHSQDAYEFVLRRAKLFNSESGGLHALGKDEKEPNILGMGIGDMTVNDCRMCHSGSGIFSVQSYTRGLAAPVPNPQLPPASYPNASRDAVGDWKERQFDWGLLKGLLDH